MALWRKTRVYLDHAAATSPLSVAYRAFTDAQKEYGNPSSLHQEGVRARALLENARTRIARMLGVRSSGIVYTSGATEANNLAIRGIIEFLHTEGRAYEDMHVLYHEGAHTSLVEAVLALQALGVLLEPLQTLRGDVDTKKLQAQLTKHTVLVAMESVSGETGLVFSTRDVRRVLDMHAKNLGIRVLLHVDGSQAPRVRSVVLESLGADTLALDAQKIGGVRGIGLLALQHHVRLSPMLHGGSQEHGLRPGTEQPSLACAFTEALIESKNTSEHFIAHASALRSLCETYIGEIPNAQIHASANQAPHILNVSFVGRDTDYLLFLLDSKGFAVSTKSACESDKEGSRMVQIQTGNKALADSTLRISFAPKTKKSDIDRFGKALTESIRFLDNSELL